MNDGGVVVALVVLVGALAMTMVGALSLYASRNVLLARLLCGWANVANAVIHVLLMVLLRSDTERFLKAGIDDADNLVGPGVLMLLNLVVGARSLRGAGPTAAFAWNLFIAVSGSLLPVVWLAFLDEGLARWPYPLVFLWLGIYAFESMGFFCSCAWFALRDAKAD